LGYSGFIARSGIIKHAFQLTSLVIAFLSLQDGVVKASMVIEGSEGGKSSSARIKCMETLVGGSGYLVCSCTSEGEVSVWDMEGAANALMDDDDDDDDDDDEKEEEEEEEEEEEASGGGEEEDDDSDVR
jgi:hypothetical protein